MVEVEVNAWDVHCRERGGNRHIFEILYCDTANNLCVHDVVGDSKYHGCRIYANSVGRRDSLASCQPTRRTLN